MGGGKAGQVQGTLFLPETPGPGVLCLSGAGGARVSPEDKVMVSFPRQEDTAAFLAGKGFTTLALAYFGAPGLPRFQLTFLSGESFGQLQELRQSFLGVL